MLFVSIKEEFKETEGIRTEFYEMPLEIRKPKWPISISMMVKELKLLNG